MLDTVIGNGPPFYYNYDNVFTSTHDPSTMHANNTGLTRFFAKYLLEKVFSVYEWKFPKEWARDYFMYVLYCWGFISIINTDKFGVIPQGCGLRGFDVFYRPTHAIITNPLLSGILEPQIGKQCTLIKLQPDYTGCLDLVQFYANMLALCASTAAVNILNSKLSYVFRASNKTQAEAFKKMFDRIASGEPAVFVDRLLQQEDEALGDNWKEFTQDLKANYIAGDILGDMRKWEMEFDTKVGIPNPYTDKKERLIPSEVAANNVDTFSLVQLWLENLKKGCEEARNMFGVEISVELKGNIKDVLESPNNAEQMQGGNQNAPKQPIN